LISVAISYIFKFSVYFQFLCFNLFRCLYTDNACNVVSGLLLLYYLSAYEASSLVFSSSVIRFFLSAD